MRTMLRLTALSVLVFNISCAGKQGDPGKQGDSGNPGPSAQLIEKLSAAGTCSADKQGSLVYSKFEQTFYTCDLGEWKQIDLNGDKGAQGEKGETGAQGEKGEAGAAGETGAQGEKGEQGAKGDRGDQGKTGDKGAQGEKGERGNTGNTGGTGDTGAKGEKGEQGESFNIIPADVDHPCDSRNLNQIVFFLASNSFAECTKEGWVSFQQKPQDIASVSNLVGVWKTSCQVFSYPRANESSEVQLTVTISNSSLSIKKQTYGKTFAKPEDVIGNNCGKPDAILKSENTQTWTIDSLRNTFLDLKSPSGNRRLDIVADRYNDQLTLTGIDTELNRFNLIYDTSYSCGSDCIRSRSAVGAHTFTKVP